MTASAARRMALAASGFSDPPPSGRVDVRHFRRVMKAIDLVQLDSVNVSARTHYWVFFSRLGIYPMERLDDWLWRSGEHFEYWAHEASVLPKERRPLLAHRMRAARPKGRVEAIMRDHPGYLDRVLDEIGRRGPLTVGDLSDPGERTGPWWGYGKGKIALEWHFRTGAVTVSERAGFTRLYELTERVMPAELVDEHVEAADARLELLERSARALGVGTVSDLADYYRMKVGDARAALPELIRRGVVREVEVSGWGEPAYRHVDASVPRSVEGATLVSPFDPLVWNRDRAERVFGFHYRIEIYLPERQRRYGYYVLPFLLDGELVGRVDLKNDRQSDRLVVRAAHLEDGHDPRRVAARLAELLHDTALWLGRSTIEVGPVGELAPPLSRAMT